jgi:hypothetical protein
MGNRINLQNPQFIVETSDPSKAEPQSPSVTNRAPRQIESNVERIKARVETNIENEIAIVVGEYADYVSSKNYMKGDIVKDSSDNTYYSVADNNKGNNLTDTSYWKPYVGIMPTKVLATENPTKNDKDYPAGEPWVNTDSNRVFVKTNESRSDDAVWVEITNVGDTDLSVAVVDSNYTATVNTYILARTSDDTNDYTIKLPSDPADMDLVKIGDYDANAANNPVHIDGNGNKIENDNTLDADVNDFLLEITWNDKASKWVILNK